MTRTFAVSSLPRAFATLVLALAWIPAIGQVPDVRESGETAYISTGPGPDTAPVAQAAAIKSTQAIDNTANYAFLTLTTQSLQDMSSGTTQLIGPDVATASSPLTNIGFDFWFQGLRYTQFSVNPNGVLRLGGIAQTASPYQPLGQAGLPTITAYGAAQRTHAGDGKVHYKVVTSGGSRQLEVEWLNMQSDAGAGGTADLTYQVLLGEQGGIVFAYGSMTMGATGAAASASKAPAIGFSSNNVANTIGSVTAAQGGAPAPTFNGASATVATNTYAAGPITVLTSAAQGSRRAMLFLPPVPNAPTNLTFTAVTQLSMTLNWTDSSNEGFYAIYRSTDGINYAFETTQSQNVTSYAATSLTPGTTYSWKVFAVSAEGGLSTALAGSQATNPSGNISSKPAGGLWSSTSTWVGNLVPLAGDHVTIATGATVLVDTDLLPAVAYDLTVQNGAILQFGKPSDPSAGVELDVGKLVTIAAGGTVTRSLTSSGGHNWSIGGDLVNNGSIDVDSNANNSRVAITFTGTSDAFFTLNPGSTSSLRVVTVNKGTSSTPLLTFNPGVAFSSAPQFSFVVVAGTLKIAGTAIVTTTVFDSIPAAAGFWLDNPSATITTEPAILPTLTGLMRVTAGTLNIPTFLNLAVGASVVVEGGSIKVGKYFGVSSPSNAITYSQSGGTLTVSTASNASNTIASFDLGTAAGSSVTMSGGTIIVETPNQSGSGPRDYRHQAGGSNGPAPTGGTLQLGDPATAARSAFNIAGIVPDLMIPPQTPVTFLPAAVAANAARNVTVGSGSTLDVGDNLFVVYGTSFVNNGTLTANTANAVLYFLHTTAAQTWSGSGAVTAPLNALKISSDLGLTLSPANNIVVQNIVLLSGNVTNSNKLTLGNGGAGASLVQIGDNSPSAAGTFDLPFTFNLGSGGEIVEYLRTTTARTTGNEINPTRHLTSLRYDDNNPAHSLTIDPSGDLLLDSTGTALTLINGRIVTNGLLLWLTSPTATVSRTGGRVDGFLRKAFSSLSPKTFEVGTANGYSPVTVTPSSASGFYTITAVQGPEPSMPLPSAALQRYWQVSPSPGLNASLTFTYLDPTDLPAAGVENSFVVFRDDGAALTQPGGSVDTVGNTATVNVPFSSAHLYYTLGAPVNMFIAKTHVGANFTQGQNDGQYELAIKNGPTAVPDGTLITVTDSLPAGLTFVSTIPPAWNCGASGQVVTCTITQASGVPFSANGGSNIILTVSVAANAAATLQNTATCTCSTSIPANNTSTDTVSVIQVPPDLTIAKSHTGNFAQGQTTLLYKLMVNNVGAGAVVAGSTQTVTEQPPTGLTITSMDGNGWNCQLATTSCTRSDQLLSTQGYPPITVVVSVAANATSPLLNTATIATTGPDANPNNNSATDSTTIVPGVPLTVTLAGSGFGTVTGPAGSGIACPGACSNNYPGGTVIALTAAPNNANYVFTGWLGACTGTGTCTVTMNAARNVSATFAPVAIGTHILDVDGDGNYDALSDGLLVIRYLFQLRGAELTNNAVANGATRSTPELIVAFLDDAKPFFDIDGDGTPDALSDGLMVLRYLFQLSGPPLTADAIRSGATRTDPTAIQNYLSTLKP